MVFLSTKLLIEGHEPHFHLLYTKQNESSGGGANSFGPPDKTLFVLNIPPYINKENIQSAFEDAGSIKNVIMCRKPGEIADSGNFINFQFKCAYIEYHYSKGLQEALKLKQVSSGPIRSGLTKWAEDYCEKTPVPEDLQKRINDFMTGFDERKRQEELKLKNGEADDEGWITVTKKSHPVVEKRESILNRIEEKIEKGKERKELTNFYRFQLKESKMKHIVGLRKRFEEDKKKIELMRKSRRFKP